MVSLIELENLSKVYEGESEPVHALRSVSLTISEGDYVAVTGPSGSGKSTLLNIIGGLDTPSSGKCVVAGRNLPALGDYEPPVQKDFRRIRIPGFQPHKRHDPCGQCRPSSTMQA